MRFVPAEGVTDEQRRRADAMLKCRTDRLPFLAPVDWQSFEPLLRGGIDGGGVRLDVLPEETRPRLAEAAEFTESLRLYDSPYHLELDWWTAPFEVSEGIPYSSLISAAESHRVGVNRHFPFTRNLDRRTRASLDNPTICSPGRYPTHAVPTKGSRWCSHTERSGMSRARTSSS